MMNQQLAAQGGQGDVRGSGAEVDGSYQAGRTGMRNSEERRPPSDLARPSSASRPASINRPTSMEILLLLTPKASVISDRDTGRSIARM